MSESDEITPKDLSEIIETVQLVDVRETFEREIAEIGGVSIPLAELETRAGELDSSKPTIVYCHHGIRSRHALQILQDKGFSDVRNLAGGIDRWSNEVDSEIPKY